MSAFGSRSAPKPIKPFKQRRRELCAKYGVKNTGRQWRMLKKRLRREQSVEVRGIR